MTIKRLTIIFGLLMSMTVGATGLPSSLGNLNGYHVLTALIIVMAPFVLLAYLIYYHVFVKRKKAQQPGLAAKHSQESKDETKG